MNRNSLLFVVVIAALFSVSANAVNISVFSNKESGKVQFAIREIENVLKEKEFESAFYSITEISKMRAGQTNIVLFSLNDKAARGLIKKAAIKNTSELEEEGFIIHNTGQGQKTIYVLGYDEAGTMYGGLEVAEIIKVKGVDAVQNQLQNPYMKVQHIQNPAMQLRKTCPECGILNSGRNISIILRVSGTISFRYGACIHFRRW